MIRILIVDDTRLYREGLAQLLGRNDRLSVVGVAGERDDALACVRELDPDIVLLHMGMPDSFEILRAMVATAPRTKVVGLRVAETEDEILACAESGIAGYLPRDGSLDDLLSTVDSVARGEVLCSPRVAATLLRRVATLAVERRPRAVAANLTPREREIVGLIDEGLSNKEIALRLSIEVHTVKNHVHNILEKLKVHRRGEAAARLREDGTIRRSTSPPYRAQEDPVPKS